MRSHAFDDSKPSSLIKNCVRMRNDHGNRLVFQTMITITTSVIHATDNNKRKANLFKQFSVPSAYYNIEVDFCSIPKLLLAKVTTYVFKNVDIERSNICFLFVSIN